MLILFLLCFSGAFAALEAHAADALKVIVVDGDEAANIVAERIAAEPVIEVRDRDNRRVPNAVVRFLIRKTARNRLAAVFRNGQPEIRTLTDQAGRATADFVTPLEPGSFDIDVQVSYRGETGKATIRQTNYPTTADAKANGREPAKSSNPAAQAAAASAAPPSAGSAALAVAGGGISKVAVVGLVAGGAAGAGAAVVLTQRKSEPPATVAPIVASQAVGIFTATPFTFSAQATGFEAGSLAYRWEFGDGATSTEPSPTHVYEAPGTYTVTVTVSDARRSARSDMSVTVLGLTGTWVRATGRAHTMQLTQSGATITGSGDIIGVNPTTGAELFFPECPVLGSVERAVPVAVTLTLPGCRNPQGSFLRPARISLTVAPDGRSMTGVLSQEGGPDQPYTLVRP